MTSKILNFAAIDVETANPNRESVCQVGIAVVKSGKIVEVWSELVNPQAEFYFWNVRVHGIDAHHVLNAPTFGKVYPEIVQRTAGAPIVSHSPFDKSAVSQACARHRLPMLTNGWKDSIEIAKRAWPRRQSYSLPIIAKSLGIDYDEHDAGEDAEAAAKLVLRAGDVLGAARVYNWLRRR